MFISDSAPYSLRSSNNMHIPPTPNVRSDFNPHIACQQVWNSLPSSVQKCYSFGTIKKILKDHLVKNPLGLNPYGSNAASFTFTFFYILFGYCSLFLVVAYIVFFVSPLYPWPWSLSRGNKSIVFPFSIYL